MAPIIEKYTKNCLLFIAQYVKKIEDYNKNFIQVQFQLLDSMLEQLTSLRSLTSEKVEAWNDQVLQNLQIGLNGVKESKAIMENLSKQIENSKIIIAGKST